MRRATHTAHRDLEARLPIARCPLAGGVYRDHLLYLLGFHAPLERKLDTVARLPDAVPDISLRKKTRLLRADVGSPADGILCADRELPPVSSVEQALGVLYVLEGATLGARSLLPRLVAGRAIPAGTGTAYFEGYGKRTGHMWKRLCAVFDGVPEGRADVVVASARATFAGLNDWRSTWECRRD